MAVAKTPVSLLGELTVSYHTQPIYKLIQDATGPTGPSFKYKAELEIIGKQISAIGNGRSKKEAKHNAAQKVLEILREILSMDSPKNDSDTTNLIELDEPISREVVSYKNTIGELQNICQIRKLPMPQYDLVSMEGPPHACVFKTQCSVANIIKTAESYTKKQSKQIVAGIMIEYLNSEDIQMPDLIDSSAEVLEKILNSRMKSVSMVNGSPYKNPLQDLNEDVKHAALEVLNEPDDSVQLLSKAFDILKLNFNILKQNTKSNKTLYYINIHNLPELVFSEYTIPALCTITVDALKILLK